MTLQSRPRCNDALHGVLHLERNKLHAHIHKWTDTVHVSNSMLNFCKNNYCARRAVNRRTYLNDVRRIIT